MGIFGWVFIGIIVLLLLYAMSVYNGLVRLRALAKEGRLRMDGPNIEVFKVART